MLKVNYYSTVLGLPAHEDYIFIAKALSQVSQVITVRVLGRLCAFFTLLLMSELAEHSTQLKAYQLAGLGT